MQESVKPKYKNKIKRNRRIRRQHGDETGNHTADTLTKCEVELAGKDFFAWGLINYSLYLHFINVWVKIDLPH